MNKPGLKNKLSLWAVSFILAAILLFFYFHAPLLPILLAGIGTLALVLFRHYKSSR